MMTRCACLRVKSDDWTRLACVCVVLGGNEKEGERAKRNRVRRGMMKDFICVCGLRVHALSVCGVRGASLKNLLVRMLRIF